MSPPKESIAYPEAYKNCSVRATGFGVSEGTPIRLKSYNYTALPCRTGFRASEGAPVHMGGLPPRKGGCPIMAVVCKTGFRVSEGTPVHMGGLPPRKGGCPTMAAVCKTGFRVSEGTPVRLNSYNYTALPCRTGFLACPRPASSEGQLSRNGGSL